MSAVSIHSTTVAAFIDRLPDAFDEGDSAAASKRIEAENVRRLQEQYRGIARGDFASVMAAMADDIEMEMIGPPEIPLVGRWQGRQQVAEAVRNNFALLADQQAELLTVVAQGDTVVLLAKEQGRFRATGKPYTMHWAQWFTFRNGRVVRVRGLFDSAALLAAVRPA